MIIGYNARSTFAGTVEIVIGMHVNLYSSKKSMHKLHICRSITNGSVAAAAYS